MSSGAASLARVLDPAACVTGEPSTDPLPPDPPSVYPPTAGHSGSHKRDKVKQALPDYADGKEQAFEAVRNRAGDEYVATRKDLTYDKEKEETLLMEESTECKIRI